MQAQSEQSLAITDEEYSAYRRDGFLVRERVFSEPEARALRAAADRAADQARAACAQGTTYHLDGKRFVDVGPMTVQFEHAPGSETVRVIEPVHMLDPDLDALVDDPRLTRPMQRLVGSLRLSLWTDKLNLKRPREGSAFGWHQDAPYWIHDCGHVDQLPNVLVGFDDASRANGCFRVVRGSHTDGCLPGTDDGSQLGGFYTDPAYVRETDIVHLEVPAGSVVFFDPYTVHGSAPNRSETPRRAMVLTYQPAGHPMLKTGRERPVRVSA